MTCEEFVEFMCDYVEGRLPEDQAAQFEQRIESCEHCRNFLATYERTIKMSRKCVFCDETEGELPEDVPDGLVGAILASRKGPAATD